MSAYQFYSIILFNNSVLSFRIIERERVLVKPGVIGCCIIIGIVIIGTKRKSVNVCFLYQIIILHSWLILWEELYKMKKDYYIINDIAQITGLTDRTIRTYIKNGFLHGKKDGGIWMFTEEELGRFLAQDYVKQSIQTKAESIIRDFIINKKKNRNYMCTILDYPVNSLDHAEAISDTILKEMTENQMSDINFYYNYDKKIKIARIIISGRREQVTRILIVLDEANDTIENI